MERLKMNEYEKVIFPKKVADSLDKRLDICEKHKIPLNPYEAYFCLQNIRLHKENSNILEQMSKSFEVYFKTIKAGHNYALNMIDYAINWYIGGNNGKKRS